MRFLQWLSHLIYPEKCVLCGRILEKEELDLCRSCRIDAPECPISMTKRTFLDSWTALWYYEGGVRRSLLRYKFRGKQKYAESYGRLLAMKLLKEDRGEYDLLTFIPISPKRLKKRGFDQVQLLSEFVGRELGLPPVATLVKVRHNQPQSGITGHAQRRANVLGAYEMRKDVNIKDKRVLLLDDIITSGATAGEAARVLLTAGAKEVHLAVIAAANHDKTKR